MRETPTLRHAAALAALGMGLALARGAAAQNLLANPGFDESLQPWQSVEAEFNNEDAAGSPDSGSVRLETVNQSAANVSQCVNIVPGTRFLAAGGSYRVAAGQPASQMSVFVAFRLGQDCNGVTLENAARFADFEVFDAWGTTHRTLRVPSGTQSALVVFGLFLEGPEGTAAAKFDDLFFEPTDALLLRGGRFVVSADFATTVGLQGRAPAVELTDESGYFWFFNEDNVELIVKVLDGCTLNDHFWVFAGGLTDVTVQLTVFDLLTGFEKIYGSEQGTPFPPLQDTSAIPTCDPPF